MLDKPMLTTTMTSVHRGITNSKRKSAVELLQESKMFYVKSEKVRGSKQEFKHSEHLQVSSNPNFDRLLKPSATAAAAAAAGRNGPESIPCRRSIPEFKLKMIERKLYELNNFEHKTHHHHNSHHHHNHHHNHHQNGTAVPPPALPPKSPRNLRPRSRTQPESCSGGIASQGGTNTAKHHHHHEYRRSQSMPDKEAPPDDIQMKLRRLLNTDSKENLAGSQASLNKMPLNKTPLKTPIKTPQPVVLQSPETSPPLIVSAKDSCVDVSPDSNDNVFCARTYSVHKSLPDLFTPNKMTVKTQNGGGHPKRISRTARSSPTPSNGGGSVGCQSDDDCDDDDCAASVDGSLSNAMPQKSVELRRTGSRATSDYVSRSPSYKCEYLLKATTIFQNGDVDHDDEQVDESQVDKCVVANGQDVTGGNHHRTTTTTKVPQPAMDITTTTSFVNEMNNNKNHNNNNNSALTSCNNNIKQQPPPQQRHPPPPPPKRKSITGCGTIGGTAVATCTGVVPPPVAPKSSKIAVPPPDDHPVVLTSTFNVNTEGAGKRQYRPILRSKSDISHRFSRSTGEFIQDGGVVASPSKRVMPSDAYLDRFFGQMGLDTSVFQHLSSAVSCLSSSPVFFSSTSSIDSSHRARSASHNSGGGGGTGGDDGNCNDSDGSPVAPRSGPAPTTATTPSGAPPPSLMTSLTTPNPRHTSGNASGLPGLTNKDLAQHGPTETSIVERNARVIKWLYNCRKAMTATANAATSTSATTSAATTPLSASGGSPGGLPGNVDVGPKLSS